MTTVTSKGQITIPKQVRDALGLMPGSQVEFTVEPEGVMLRRRIPPEVFDTELAGGFDLEQPLVRFLGDIGVQPVPFSTEALGQAGQASRRYALGRGRQVQCPRCGRRFDVPCAVCGSPVIWRQHVIADFLIGGHAVAQADALITRDPGYYRTYFPELELITPVLNGA